MQESSNGRTVVVVVNKEDSGNRTVLVAWLAPLSVLMILAAVVTLPLLRKRICTEWEVTAFQGSVCYCAMCIN
jgi:hypothetical protein